MPPSVEDGLACSVARRVQGSNGSYNRECAEPALVAGLLLVGARLLLPLHPLLVGLHGVRLIRELVLRGMDFPADFAGMAA